MSFRTLVSSSNSSLLHNLHKSTAGKPQENAFLFSISANASAIEEIVTLLRQQARYTVGCLSAPFSGEMHGKTVCSIARFNARECVPFRSDAMRRPPTKIEEWNHNFSEDIQDFFKEDCVKLPHELLEQRDLGSVVTFSDSEFHGFTRALAQSQPQVNHLGLIASSTPFVTGRPYTMFFGDKIYSSGAVGLGLKKNPPKPPSITYDAIIPLSNKMRVTKSVGNLIFEIDNGNPVEKLKTVIDQEGRIPERDGTYLIAAYQEEDPRQISKLFRITGGSPSRGALSLEGEHAPKPQQLVQFYMHDPKASLATLSKPSLTSLPAYSLNFISSSEVEESIAVSENDVDAQNCLVFEHKFISSSENGIIFGERGGLASKCNIPGTIASWNFQ